MAFELKLPDIGEGVAEGEIVRWLVRVGDGVKEDQPLVEVMTDKATVELPSPRAGTIKKINYKDGDICPVGRCTAIIRISRKARRRCHGWSTAAAWAAGQQLEGPLPLHPLVIL